MRLRQNGILGSRRYTPSICIYIYDFLMYIATSMFVHFRGCSAPNIGILDHLGQELHLLFATDGTASHQLPVSQTKSVSLRSSGTATHPSHPP